MQRNPFDLTGRRALITGSTQGIGLALAYGLAESGASVVLNGRDAARVDAAVKEMVADGFEAAGAVFDVTQQSAVAAGVDEIEKSIGAIDILILLPIALPIFGTVLSMLIGGVGVFVAGGFVMVAGSFMGLPGGALAAALLGVGLMGLGVFMVALMALLTKWLIDATIWYARLHYRVLKPALEPQA